MKRGRDIHVLPADNDERNENTDKHEAIQDCWCQPRRIHGAAKNPADAVWEHTCWARIGLVRGRHCVLHAGHQGEHQ